MASLTISFRIADETIGGRTYDDRLDKLNTAIKAAVSGTYWDRTTSFYAIQTNRTIDEMIQACRSAIAPTHDVVLILDADSKSGRITGNNTDADIFKIIPYIQKL